MQGLSPWIGIFALLTGVYASADERVDHEKLIGSWQLQDSSAEKLAKKWIFKVNGGNLQVTQLDGDKVITKFHCSINGSICQVETGGDKGTISVWHNEAALMQMETKGSVIIKRRFAVLAQGNVMEMEVIPIVPGGKTETFRFHRLLVSAQSK